MEKRKVYCNICKKRTKYIADNFTRYHLKPVHNIKTMKDYYDIAVKKKGGGLCHLCKKDSKFISLNFGYQKYCSNKCALGEHNSNWREWAPKVKKTYLERYKTSHPMKNLKIQEKRRKTCLKNNGTEYPTQNKKIYNKMVKTLLKKYGATNIFQSELLRKRYGWSHPKDKPEFQQYSAKVRLLTTRHKKKLYENWDGRCYYTKKKLVLNADFKKRNPNKSCTNNVLQPTIDHKTPVVVGFMKKIAPEVISRFSNLCICSRKSNSRKNALTEKQFFEKLLRSGA